MTENQTLRIAIAQLNFWVGDIEGNTNKIISASVYARDVLKAELIVFSELALTGYSPEDLLLRNDFNMQVQKAVEKIKKAVTHIGILFGYPKKENNNACYNKAILLQDGCIIANYSKQILPNYSVFDEERYFKSGNQSCVFEIKKIPIALLICEDIWHPKPLQNAVLAGAQFAIVINASPFEMRKAEMREDVLKQRCGENNISIVYVNTVGGQDELVFDGGSMIVNALGDVCERGKFFKEDLFYVDMLHINKGVTLNQKSEANFSTCLGWENLYSNKEEMQFYSDFANPLCLRNLPLHIKKRNPAKSDIKENNIAYIYNALVLSVQDYLNKNNFKRVMIGLSGGIDSALVLAIAVDALGANHVEAVMMPSHYTALMSLEDAEDITQNLGVSYTALSIKALFETTLNTLEPVMDRLSYEDISASDITEQNIQARLRGLLLMALANKKNALVLSTSNKSEMAVGYATLYGDMVGGFCVLKDVYKTIVYQLANYRNTISAVIPQRIIDRPPSAELAPNQKDADVLPPYPILDEILQRYIEQSESIETIIAAGFDETVVHQIIKLLYRSEHKRRQAAPGPRITNKAFGKDRRYPITCSII